MQNVLAGNPPSIGKYKLELQNLQISEWSFANYLKTLTSIGDNAVT